MEEKKETKEIPVGEKIKTLREQKGLLLKDVADRTGFSAALISQMENHLVSPSLGTLIKLAKALDVNPQDLRELLVYRQSMFDVEQSTFGGL